jgi:hypothetical protein
MERDGSSPAGDECNDITAAVHESEGGTFLIGPGYPTISVLAGKPDFATAGVDDRSRSSDRPVQIDFRQLLDGVKLDLCNTAFNHS